MGILKAKGLRDVSKEIPACCGNCRHNLWEEEGPQCCNPKSWELDKWEVEHGCAEPDMSESLGSIDWTMVCDNHERGRYQV